MTNAQIDRTEVENAIDSRRAFRNGVYLHFIVFSIVNIIVWLAWALGPKDGSIPYIPIVISGSWAIVLIVHSAFVFFSHRPRQVGRDELRRQIEQAEINGEPYTRR
jgi:hypothetical protein